MKIKNLPRVPLVFPEPFNSAGLGLMGISVLSLSMLRLDTAMFFAMFGVVSCNIFSILSTQRISVMRTAEPRLTAPADDSATFGLTPLFLSQVLVSGGSIGLLYLVTRLFLGGTDYEQLVAYFSTLFALSFIAFYEASVRATYRKVSAQYHGAQAMLAATSAATRLPEP